MIIEFSLGNFKSFKDPQSLSLIESPIKPRYKWLGMNSFKGNDEYRLLKSKAIYGSNASGKSNLIKGLMAFINIITSSLKDNKALDYIEPYMLLKEKEYEPTFFQLIFIVEGTKYRYGFEATNEKIHSEWLFGKPGEKEVHFFIREDNNIRINSSKFAEGDRLKSLENEENEIVRSNALFLSVAAALNGNVSKTIVEALSQIIIIGGVSDLFMKKNAYEMLENEEQKNRVVRFLNEAGIDIKDIFVEENEIDKSKSVPGIVKEISRQSIPPKTIYAIRTQYDEDGNAVDIAWDFEKGESDGTNKMLQLSPFILSAIEYGRTLIIDEFEARLHTNLAKSIVKLFNRKESNPQNAQFVFSTHDTNLLSPVLTRRDQILFIRKDKVKGSRAYNLSDIKGVRNDENYEKNYLTGKYSAVPRIGTLDLALID